MANTLFDAIQASQQQDPSEIATAQPLGQTQQAQRLLQAKTGKSVGPGSTPQISDEGERFAAYQTGLGAKQLGMQGAIQSAGQQQQAAGIQQGADIGKAQFSQQRGVNQLQLQLQTNQMLGDLERQGKTLDQQKSQAQLEQIGTGIALQNKQYLDNLQNEGSRARLDDSAQFQQNLQKSVFGDSLTMLQQQLGQQDLLRTDKRTFQDKMDRMSLGDSIMLMKKQAQAGQQQQMWSGIGGLSQAGIQAYGASKNQPKAEDTGNSSSISQSFGGTDASGAAPIRTGGLA